MTVAIACAFQDGVLFCADTKITTGQQKTHESKIYVHRWGSESENGVSVFTVSGEATYAAMAIRKCERAIAELDFAATSLDEIQDEIEAVLASFYQMHIFPHPDREDVNFDLLIGLWLNGETRILANDDTALRLVRGYECVGSGGYLARYWLRQALGSENQFMPERLTLAEASLALEYAISHAAEYDEFCGFESGEPYYGEPEFMGMKHDGQIGDVRKHAYMYDFPEQLHSETWVLLKRLAKSQSIPDVESAVDEFCERVRGLHKPIVRFMEECKRVQDIFIEAQKEKLEP